MKSTKPDTLFALQLNQWDPTDLICPADSTIPSCPAYPTDLTELSEIIRKEEQTSNQQKVLNLQDIGKLKDPKENPIGQN